MSEDRLSRYGDERLGTRVGMWAEPLAYARDGDYGFHSSSDLSRFLISSILSIGVGSFPDSTAR